MRLQFEARLPARKFRTYVCVGRASGNAAAGAKSDDKQAAEGAQAEAKV